MCKFLPGAALVVMLNACATSPPPKPMPFIPPDWAAQLDLDNTRCAPVAGQFDNTGEHYLATGAPADDGLLAEDVLARQLPTGRPAEIVILRSDTERNLLDAQIVGQVSRKIAIEVSCDGGWHTFSFERSGTYVGGGVKEKQFRQVSYFREDGRGRLVARVVKNAEFMSDIGSGSSVSSENWYRFELHKVGITST